MNFQELHTLKKGKYPGLDPKALRVHRAISWGIEAEKEQSGDKKFIFYWIALNSAYADDKPYEDERSARKAFFEKISDLDSDNRIRNALISIQNQLRLFVANKHLYKAYWEAQKGNATESDVEWQQSQYKNKIYSGLMSKEDLIDVLDYLFALMSILRNQIFHGLATYNSQKNRGQVQAGVKILETIVPIMVEYVLEHDEVDWGKDPYPCVDD